MTDKNEEGLGLVWGVEAIAKKIGRTPRQTFHMCSTGVLPAKKVGARWVAKDDVLERFFEETAA